VAATDGAVDTHLNLFNAANKLLLAVACCRRSRRRQNLQPNTSALIAEAKRVRIHCGSVPTYVWICGSERVVGNWEVEIPSLIRPSLVSGLTSLRVLSKDKKPNGSAFAYAEGIGIIALDSRFVVRA
jgi:hypothetical protein